MDRVVRALERITTELPIHSAAIAVRVEGRTVLEHTAGAASPGQPFDLASVTKALAGSVVAAGLFEAGRLAPADRVARIPGVHPALTVRHLLEHSGGFPAWAPLHQTEADRDGIVAAACRMGTGEPGRAEVYSDLGFLALLRVLELAGEARLDHQLAAWVGEELRWGWPGAAPTQGTPGVVHDPLARAMGGVSSHAGLFGSALVVARLAEAVTDAAAGRRSDLPGRSLRALWDGPSPGTHRGGWDTISPARSTAGARWPRDGVGHLGYTGTSVWVARDCRVVVALLTNRVHPDDRKDAILSARPAVHDAVAHALGWR